MNRRRARHRKIVHEFENNPRRRRERTQLENVTLEIPRDKLVVMTGLSGSGKSSLAFDTIYAEGQRRYVESLSAYARQFLELMQKPDVDQIDGLSPAISIEQKTTSRNPRSTVGTVTEIYDYMRLLWARIGVPYSPATGLPITSQTVSEMVDRLMEAGEGARFYLLAPIIRGRKGEYRKEFADLQKKGFQRVKVDGVFYEISETPKLNKRSNTTSTSWSIALSSKPALKADSQNRSKPLWRSLTALRWLNALQNKKTTQILNASSFLQSSPCPESGFTIDEIEPRLFSFNAPAGACPSCDGLGTQMIFNEDLVVPDESLPLTKGAIAPWSKGQSPYYYRQTLEALAHHYGFDAETEWRNLDRIARDVILYGTGDEDVSFIYRDGSRKFETVKPFEGVIPNLERRWRETDSSWVREELSRFQSITACDDCDGMRLKPEALSVKIDGLNISEATRFSIRAAGHWFDALEAKLTKKQKEIAVRVLKEIRDRLAFLNNVGLDYLTLSRASGTLSGGESQRIRLASQIGSGLTGVLYVLDEPSIGLHQRDNERLIETLKRLRDLGNSVLVVEHDEDAMLSADHIVDIGPGAGVHGGQIIAQGRAADIKSNKQSLTGDYLSGRRSVPVPVERRSFDKKQDPAR